MLKNIFINFMLFIFIFSVILYADEYDFEKNDFEKNDFDFLEVSNTINSYPTIYSNHILVLERTTETVLLEKNGYEKTPMASTTKIMTAIIAIENSNLSDLIPISKNAAYTPGSTLGITENTVITMESLLYGLLMRSGNDCAVAIAEYISGNIDSFSDLMNQKAKNLGLKNTHFITPHGLDADNHFTTAYDLALLTNYALKNETFSKIVNTKSTVITLGNYTKNINNTNELLGYLDGVYGVKTGFTGNAGRCLVSACKRGNLDIIVVVLGSDTKKIRTTDSIKIINYIYSNYEMKNTYDYIISNFNIKKIKIKNSFQNAELYIDQNFNYIYPILKNSNNYKIKIYFPQNQKAPLEKNSKIGIIKFFSDEKFIYETNIYLSSSIYSITFSEYFSYTIQKIKNLFNYNF